MSAVAKFALGLALVIVLLIYLLSPGYANVSAGAAPPCDRIRGCWPYATLTPTATPKPAATPVPTCPPLLGC